jgi:hypothetical protein
MSEQRWRTKQDGAELVTSYEPGTRRKRKGLCGEGGQGQRSCCQKDRTLPPLRHRRRQSHLWPFDMQFLQYATVSDLGVGNFFTVRDLKGGCMRKR